MTNVEVVLKNGSVHKIDYDGSQQDFLDMAKYGKESTFVVDVENYYIFISSIIKFKFL